MLVADSKMFDWLLDFLAWMLGDFLRLLRIPLFFTTFPAKLVLGEEIITFGGSILLRFFGLNLPSDDFFSLLLAFFIEL
jgi:hypothetical protein